MESKQPYGLYFLSSLLKLHAESFDVVKESPAQFLEKNTFQDATYFIVGDYTYLDNKDVSQLLNFVDSGNEIFLAVEQVPKILFDTIATILDSTNQYWLSSSSFHNNKIFHRFNTKEFYTDTLVEHRYRYELNDTIEYTWHYFFREFFCIEDSKACALTLDEDNYVDYASFYIGKGKINIFLNPICLTNYFYDSWSGKQFVERVMSFVNLKHVLWDEFSKINMGKIGDSNYGRSPLNTILKFESLKWAWYLFLFTLLLLICSSYTGGDWFWVSYVPTVFGIALFILPFILKALPFPKILSNHKALIYFIINSGLLFLTVVVAMKYSGYFSDYTKIACPIIAISLAPAWLMMLTIRYLKINGFFRTS
ncbi:MAG TPA: hypothetical protein PLH86_10810, partial [Saprospiraceae bacterium]|nr:hypothetical protein [Saprospiraceae bacterium]